MVLRYNAFNGRLLRTSGFRDVNSVRVQLSAIVPPSPNLNCYDDHRSDQRAKRKGKIVEMEHITKRLSRLRYLSSSAIQPLGLFAFQTLRSMKGRLFRMERLISGEGDAANKQHWDLWTM